MNVVVIGAGIVGYATAYALASRGAHVRIVDSRGAGRGATQASAGMLAPHVEGHSDPLLRLGACSLAQYDAFIGRIRADADQRIEYRRTGTLQVARDHAEAETLMAAAARLAAAEVPHTYLDGSLARELEPALGRTVAAGLVIPQHGYVGVAALMSALAAAASRCGVQLDILPVRRVEAFDGHLQVVTAAGALAADAVVIAAGSWSGRLSMGAAAAPVRPIRGQLLHLRLAEPVASRIIWGTRAYVVPWQDGRVLVGATSEDVGFDESATTAGVQDLLEGATELLPSLRTARFEEVRVGLRPATADELPVIGPSSTMPGLYYATGHYRNGVLLAPLTALMLADLIVDGRQRSELELVRPDRFGL